MLLASILSMALAAPAPGDVAILQAFKAGCARVDDEAGMKADAVAGGWEEVAEDHEPRVASLIKLGRDALAGEEGTRMTGATFRRAHADRQLFLVQSRVEDRLGIWANGCRLYDFDAAAPLDVDALTSWMGKPPTGVQDFGRGFAKRLWEPGWRDGVSVEISHVPAGNNVGAAYGIQGNVLVAQAIGGFENLGRDDQDEAADATIEEDLK